MSGFDGYTSHHLLRDNDRRGGGVSVLVAESFKCQRLGGLSVSTENIECLPLLVSGGGRKFVVCAIYRPPNSDSNK